MEEGVLRRELFDVWRNEPNISKRLPCVCDYIMAKRGFENSDGHIRKQVQKTSAEFCKILKERWTNSHYILKRFLEIKLWQIRKENKAQVEDRNKLIQDRLRKEMGLLVDIPKPGFGTTNDGNSARRFFENPILTADITGVDEELILRFGTILKTIASGYSINTEEFEKYCFETAELYVQEYKWYYGTQLIKEAILPIGMMSEEAQESRNKDYRNFREYHARKFSRADTMTDLMHMLLISSDPIVSSLRVKRERKSKSISLRLLSDPRHDEDDDSDDDDYYAGN